jgi:hypothetical protein
LRPEGLMLRPPRPRLSFLAMGVSPVIVSFSI